MDQVKQLSFFTDHRAPALVRARHHEPGICGVCGRFSFDTARRNLARRRIFGLPQPKAPQTRCCSACLPHFDEIREFRPTASISPTAAVQLLCGCPKAYFLQANFPQQPPSVEHALGILLHDGWRKFLGTTFATEAGFRFGRFSGLPWLSKRLNDQKLFPRGVGFRQDWEPATLQYLVGQVFHTLRNRGQLLSGKQLSEALRREGRETVWSAIELRFPPTTVAWLMGDEDYSFLPGADLWRFAGMVDFVILTAAADDNWQLMILDHKIPGVDCFPHDPRDYSLQLRLYGCWAMQAFASVGLAPEQLRLTVEMIRLNPLGAREIIAVPFDGRVYQKTLAELAAAIRLLMECQHGRAGFAARPQPWLCQSCDFGLAPRLCPESLAREDIWGLDLPYQPLGAPVQTKSRSPRGDLGN